ncbi:AraC family regulatory protein [Burkholderia lata]|uniref:AraC family transcriptional regulator n=1 Tax=Burkholderia lata (strain ATCC 17760 / DSM 23089 / LMG 22485 / NCIMB 9086 / R18194 / 383) TaxID=482957 RepID=UPI001453738E|nr:AraC family transcriptional regulator [Burkholderia lata]VWB69885.1 AraC family regulatory protein [Burkholderia lata]
MLTLPSARLAARFLELSVNELEAAHSAIANRYCNYRVCAQAADAIAPIVLHGVECGLFAVSTLAFGRTIEIEPDDLGACLLITTTIRGRAGMTAGQAQYYGGEPGATVLGLASDSPRFHYEPTAEVLKVQLDHRRVSAACWRMMRHPGRAPLRFEIAMRDSHALTRWFMLLDFVVTTLNESDAVLRDYLAPSVEEMLIVTLLDTQPHNYTAELHRSSGVIAPKQLRRAVEFMEARLGQALTLTEIAAAADCSIRSLSRAFSAFRQTTPMQHLNHLRLEKIRTELISNVGSAATISTIALQYGFTHLSAFNLQYRRRYGETPSQTRRRARDSSG